MESFQLVCKHPVNVENILHVTRSSSSLFQNLLFMLLVAMQTVSRVLYVVGSADLRSDLALCQEISYLDFSQ